MWIEFRKVQVHDDLPRLGPRLQARVGVLGTPTPTPQVHGSTHFNHMCRPHVAAFCYIKIEVGIRDWMHKIMKYTY